MADDDTSSTDVTQPFQIATAADPAHVMPLGDDPAKTITDLTGTYHGNSQECVASVKELNNLGRTSTWTPLGPIGADTQVGAPVATFNKDGKYTNTPGTSHAGTYLGVDANGNMVIGEQWDGKTWHTTTIPNTGKGGWRDASSYSVVGSNKPMQTTPDDEPPSVAIPKLASPQDEPPSVAIPKLQPASPAAGQTTAPAGQPAVPEDQPPSKAIPPLQGPGFVPTTTTPQPPQPPPGSVADRAMNAFHMGFVGDVMGPVNDWIKTGIPGVSRGVSWMDQQFPALGRLDQNIRAPTDEESAKYDKTYGNDPVSQAGRFAGQQVAISPLTLLTEGAGEALATKTGAPMLRTIFTDPATGVKSFMSVPAGVAQKLLGGAIRLGSGAVQGVESAVASGDNLLHAAASGALFHGLGDAVNALGNTQIVQKVLSSPPVVAALAGVGSFKAGESLPSAIRDAVMAGVLAYAGKSASQHVTHMIVNGIMNYAIAPVLRLGSGPLGDAAAKAVGPYTSDNKLSPAPGLVPTP